MTIADKIISVRQAIGKDYVRPDAEKVDRFIEELWNDVNTRALDYLRIERAPTDETIKYFKLGYDKERDAIAIPVYKKDVLVNIKYRFLNPDGAKYIGERGAETWLYHDIGLQTALIKRGVLVVEGEFDLMACWQSGIKKIGRASCRERV